MSTEERDQEIRELCQNNAPRVDPAAFSRKVAARTDPRRRIQRRVRRKAGLALAVVVLLAGIGIGSLELVNHLTHGQRVTLILNDDSPNGTTTTSHQPVPGGFSRDNTFGLDVRQPFIDHDATKALGDPAYKIVTTWVAVGNRQSVPLPFKLSDLTLIDAYDQLAYRGVRPSQYNYTETVTPIWTPALKEGTIAPGAIEGGYVSWKVPWYVWPQEVFYAFKGKGGGGGGQGWMTPIFPDLNAGNRFYLSIGKLLYRGVVDVPKDEDFRPEAAVTVADFAKMVVIAAAPYNRAAFSDSAGYIGEATKAGLATWGSKTAEHVLTRLEVALAVAHLAKGTLTTPPASYKFPLTDVPQSAENDLALLTYNGVVAGSTATSFGPADACSRGQACRMLALALDPRFREEESKAATSLPLGATTTTR
jgi:hypothetical protein